jgi:hypothetical protein
LFSSNGSFTGVVSGIVTTSTNGSSKF